MNKLMNKATTKLNSISKKALGAYSAAMAGLAPMVTNASSLTSYNMTGDQLIKGFMLMIAALGTVAGIFFGATSAWSYLMAQKSEDSEAKHKAQLGFIPAVGFLSFGVILGFFGFTR